MIDDLGDRMKDYEAVETSRRLDPTKPVYARLDGRGFSKFTRDLRRPFDQRMSMAMIATASALVEETCARVAYTQSDEISLVWLVEADQPESQMFFDGKVMKLASVLASFATAVFTQQVVQSDDSTFRPYAHRRPHFDARVYQLPSVTEAANAFLWREKDASRNAVLMAAHDVFSHKKLHGVGIAAMIEMLLAEGIDVNTMPGFFRYGTYLKRRLIERALTADELARIPERHRPDPETLVTRHEIEAFQMPRGLTCDERVSRIFGAAMIKAGDLAKETVR